MHTIQVLIQGYELPREIISPVITSLAGFLSAAIFSLILPKIFDHFAYRDSRELKAILDIKAGCEKSGTSYSPQLDELLKIYETRFTLSLSYWFGLHHAYPSFAFWGGIAGLFGIIIAALIIVSLFIIFFLLYPLLAGVVSGAGLLLTWQGYLCLKRLLNKQIQSQFFYSARMHHPGEGDKILHVRTFNDETTRQNVLYDYIGIPVSPRKFMRSSGTLKMYRLRRNSYRDIEYVYLYTRSMTLLEQEWFLNLNTIRRFGRKAPYVPYLIQTEKYTYNTSEYLIVLNNGKLDQRSMLNAGKV